MLDRSEFGLYKQIGVVLTAGVQLTLGFYMNVFYFLPRRPAEGPQFVRNVVFVHAAVGVMVMAVLLLYPTVLGKMASDDLIPYAPFIAIALALTIAGSFLEVVATANQDVKYSAAFIILAQLTKGAAMVTAALVGTVQALLYASIFQAVVQFGVLMWYLHKRFPGFLDRPDVPILREQLIYAGPLAVSSIAVAVRQSYHFFVVATMFSAADYAIYAVGSLSLPLIGLIRESTFSVMIPRVSLLHQQGRIRDIVSVFAAATRKLAFFHLGAYVFFTLMAAEFISLLYTPRYAASRPIFMINLLTLLVILPCDPVNRAFQTLQKVTVGIRIGTTIFLVPAVHAGIRLGGLEGAIWAVVVTALLDYALVSFTVMRALSMTRKDLQLFADVWKTVLAAALAGLAAEITRRLCSGAHPAVILMIAAGVFAAVYVGAMLLMRVPTREETSLISGKFLQIRRVFARV